MFYNKILGERRFDVRVSDLFKFITEYVNERLSDYENYRKRGRRRPLQVPLCRTKQHCHIVFEYRRDHMVYLRCVRCMRVYKKRPMDHREKTDYHARLIASIIDVESQKARSKTMVNDGSRFLSRREREGHIEYCEGMTQYYRTDKHVQFHLLDDFQLLEYVENYKYDQSLSCCLDEPVSK